MAELRFSDGTVVSHENPVALANQVEIMVRQLRKATGFREGEVRVGLHRKHYLPFLWALYGGEQVVTAFPFMGVEIFCTNCSENTK